jgi:hypothetical protein
MSKIGSYVLDQQIAEIEKSIPQIMQDMDDQVTDLFAAWERFLESESGTEINSNTAFKGEDNE